jgi:hypothetical protein
MELTFQLALKKDESFSVLLLKQCNTEGFVVLLVSIDTLEPFIRFSLWFLSLFYCGIISSQVAFSISHGLIQVTSYNNVIVVSLSQFRLLSITTPI